MHNVTNMTHPKLSVVIPAVNEVAFISRAIESVRAQQYPDLEVIVVANGSTDGTVTIAKKMADKVIVRDAPCGAGYARNIGARDATGDIIIFLDADSYLGSGVIASIATNATAMQFGSVLGRPSNTALKFTLYFMVKNAAHRARLYRGALGGLLFCTRDLFTAVRGFNPSLLLDEFYDFSLRATKAGGRYILLTNCYAVTSTRRFEKYGYLNTSILWIKLRLMAWFGMKKSVKTRVYDYK